MNIISLAQEKDKQEILALYRTMLGGPADWNENYPDEETIDFDLSRDALFIMKNEANEIIATISIDLDEEVEALNCWKITPSAELSRLCVRKDYQNQGLSKQLMQHIFSVLKSEGSNGVHILVREGHVAALTSYSHIGFKQVGTCTLFDKQFICMEIGL